MVRAGDVMNREVITVSPHASVREAARLMREHNIGTLVVVDEGYPVGIITERDLATRVVAQDLGGDTRVEDVMSTELITVSESTSIENVLATMQRHGFRRLPVLKEGKLVGILTLRDILGIKKLDRRVLRKIIGV
jgi:CBS domain-containing protein